MSKIAQKHTYLELKKLDLVIWQLTQCFQIIQIIQFYFSDQILCLYVHMYLDSRSLWNDNEVCIIIICFPFFFSEWACEDHLSMHMAAMWYQNGHLLRHGTTCEKQTPHVSESQLTTYRIWIERKNILTPLNTGPVQPSFINTKSFRIWSVWPYQLRTPKDLLL